jgi:hypothetical protein
VVSIGWVKVGLYSVLCRATTRTQPERETHPESDTAVRDVTEIHIYDIMQRVCQICNDIGQSGSGPQPLQLVPFLGEHPTIAFAKRTASDCTDKKGYMVPQAHSRGTTPLLDLIGWCIRGTCVWLTTAPLYPCHFLVRF